MAAVARNSRSPRRSSDETIRARSEPPVSASRMSSTNSRARRLIASSASSSGFGSAGAGAGAARASATASLGADAAG